MTESIGRNIFVTRLQPPIAQISYDLQEQGMSLHPEAAGLCFLAITRKTRSAMLCLPHQRISPSRISCETGLGLRLDMRS
jgi:hypothetical protein